MDRSAGAADGVEVPGIDSLMPIARGGSSIVYRGRQRNLQRDVAVKVVQAHGAPGDALSRWRREVAAIARLSSHPNIVAVYDGGVTTGGQPFIVMPLVEGGSLASGVRSRGPLPPDQVCEIGLKLASALVSTHAAGVLHRDVKPENVLMTLDGEPQLTDFGIARLLDATQTTSGSVHATIPFAAPEVLSGHPATEASDVYSLAATLCFCLTGAPPFPARPEESIVAIIGRIATQPPPDLRDHGAPSAMASVLGAGLAKDPGARPASAQEFLERLRSAPSTNAPTGVETVPLPPPTPVVDPGPDPMQALVARENRGLLVTSVAALVLLVLGAVAAITLRNDESPSAGSRPTVPSSTTASAAASPPTEAPVTTAATTASTAPTTTASADPPDTNGPSPGPGSPTSALRDVTRAYFAAIDRGDLASAYSMLSPSFRAVQSRASFDAFWGNFDRVTMQGPPDVDEGARTATAHLRTDGRREDLTLSFTPDDSGGWLIDGPRPRRD